MKTARSNLVRLAIVLLAIGTVAAMIASAAGAATVRIGSGGVLKYSYGNEPDSDGDPEETDVTIELVAGEYVLEDSVGRFQAGSGCTQDVADALSNSTIRCPAALVTAIEFSLGGGDDTVDATDLPTAISVHAGGEDDDITGGSGDDFIDLGSGEDEFAVGELGNDEILGGNGDDVIEGGEGNDTIDGRGGDDDVEGDEGNDVILGGSGEDAIFSGDGNDQVFGEQDDDDLDGEEGDDLLDGGAGADDIYGDYGSDTVTYASRSGAVNVDLSTPGGDGQVCPGPNCENDDVDPTVEQVVGGSGNDTLIGGEEDNGLYGGPGTDGLNGGGGNDLLEGGGAEKDTLTGGDGADAASYGGRSTAVNVNLGSPGSNEDTIAGDVENVIGGSSSDTLTGDGQNNVLTGNGGSDILSGGAGNDVLAGGDGNDALTGGDGGDWLLGQSGNDHHAAQDGSEDLVVCGTGADDSADVDSGIDDVNPDCETVNGTEDPGPGPGSAAVELSGGEMSYAASEADNAISVSVLGSYVLIADTAVSALTTSSAGCIAAGPNVLCPSGLISRIRVDAGAGNDVVASTVALRTSVSGGPGNDQITSGSGPDAVTGGSGNDVLVGRDGADLLDGGDGDDSLSGGGGNDEIIGGGGTDTVDYSSYLVPVRVDLDGRADDGQRTSTFREADNVKADVENIIGGNADDKLKGSRGPNLIDGRGGNDRLYGGKGDDELLGDWGDDRLSGSGGDDVLIGGNNRDVLHGASGDDYLDGSDGFPDKLACGSGEDDRAIRSAPNQLGSDRVSRCESVEEV